MHVKKKKNVELKQTVLRKFAAALWLFLFCFFGFLSFFLFNLFLHYFNETATLG